MLGDRYIVVHGDNLWKIAAKTLGGGAQWPRIWRYNNRASVVRVTGRGIADPDVIYVGQRLLIPRLPTERITSSDVNDQAAMPHLLPAAASTAATAARTVEATAGSGQSRHSASPSNKRSLKERLSRLRSPLSFKYPLDLRWPPQDVGPAIIEVRMTGDLVLMTKKSYPATYVTSRAQLEHQVTHEANHAFGKLLSDQRFIFDPLEKRLTYRSMLVSQSNTPNVPATALGVEMSSNSPLPKLRAEIRIAKLEGSIEVFRYIALDLKFVVEITPKPRSSNTPSPPAVAPGLSQSRSPDNNWTRSGQQRPTADSPWPYIVGGALVLAAGVLVIGALVDDWIPIVGQADDVAAAAAAAAIGAKGLALLRSAHSNLPRAAMPAHFEAKVTIGGPQS